MGEDATKAQGFTRKECKIKKLGRDLLQAGKATIAAAISRTKKHRVRERNSLSSDDPDNSDDSSPDPTGARKRKRKRRERNTSRKVKQKSAMFDPFVKVMRQKVINQEKASRRDHRFQKQQAQMGMQMNTLLLSILGKDTLNTQQKQTLADLSNSQHFITIDSDSD